jgi:hypothetical protein
MSIDNPFDRPPQESGEEKLEKSPDTMGREFFSDGVIHICTDEIAPETRKIIETITQQKRYKNLHRSPESEHKEEKASHSPLTTEDGIQLDLNEFPEEARNNLRELLRRKYENERIRQENIRHSPGFVHLHEYPEAKEQMRHIDDSDKLFWELTNGEPDEQISINDNSSWDDAIYARFGSFIASGSAGSAFYEGVLFPSESEAKKWFDSVIRSAKYVKDSPSELLPFLDKLPDLPIEER